MVRHVDTTHPSFDPSAAKAKFAGNFPDGIASFKESPDLVERYRRRNTGGTLSLRPPSFVM
jgi:hypothetical protein